MDGNFYYYVLKQYKGILRKEHDRNTQLFFVPVDPKKYMYLIVIGKSEDEEKTWLSQLLVRVTDEVIEDTIYGESEYFGDRFVEVENIKCKSTNPSPGKYLINFPKKGINVLSNLEIDYRLEYSTSKNRIYSIKGDLNLVTGEINYQDVRMVAAKQIAFMGKKDRFKELIKKK
jgi:hypothetical protein